MSNQKSTTISLRFLLKNTIWTVGTYGIQVALRLVTSIILARLLAPELFGIMVIVTSLKVGIELISDVGIAQNIIYHKDANDPEFYNTAWTLQVIRSIGLWLITVIAAVPISRFYQSPILAFVVPLVVFNSVLFGFSSVSVPLMQKRFQVGRLNLFEIAFAVFSLITSVIFAYLSRTIWALVFGGLFQSAVFMVSSHFLLPDVRHRFYLSKQYTKEILHFGKWIFVSSIVYFLSTNFDRLYLAKVIELQVLGVYGIARSISEMLGVMVLRFGNYILFPLISSHHQVPRSELRHQLSPIRVRSLLVVGTGFSLIVAISDLPIKIFYDERYQAASWMLPLLLTGSWLSILANLNEATLLGLGRPFYSAIANCSKFVFLLIGLPVGVTTFGLSGAILIVAVSDLFRYIPIAIGQSRERFSFVAQDFFVTLFVLLLIALWVWLRGVAGLGYSFESLPINVSPYH
jgi:O-antigen/teichoic acid export membrane protein